MSCSIPQTAHLSYFQIFVKELKNLVLRSFVVFVGCEVPIRLISHFGGKAGEALTLLVLGSVLIFLFIEDNHVWDDRIWGQLTAYLIIVTTCHLVLMYVGHLFIEQVTEFTGDGILPVNHIKLKDVDSWSGTKSVCFHLFEWFLTFDFLVTALASLRLFYLLWRTIFPSTYIII